MMNRFSRHLLSCCLRLNKWVFLIVFLIVFSNRASAQFYAIKVDALGLLTATINAEAAIVVHNQWSLHFPLKFNPLKLNDKSYQHVTAMPGARYWFVDSYSRGWFVGVNGLVSAYNFSGLLGNSPKYYARDYRYKGFGYGAGVSGGYSLPIAKRWNLECEVGIAGVYIDHEIYHEVSGESQYVGYQKGVLPVPGKIGVNVVYLF